MPIPRVLVLRAPGTNCDEESAYAFQQAGAKAERIHINRLLENPKLASDFQILCIPGGFSYGDDVAAGRILASQIQNHLNDTLVEFKECDKLILGICNGFQVLIKSGVLLEEDSSGQPIATLTWNDSGKFEDRWVNLAKSGERCAFLEGIEQLYLPVAHAEGKFVTRDSHALNALADAGQLSLRYTSANGGDVCYPCNPNGSHGNVAGICDKTGRVFGLMPHPERNIDRTNHPRWTRGDEGGCGRAIFDNAVAFFSN